jgi:hypothetical protein
MSAGEVAASSSGQTKGSMSSIVVTIDSKPAQLVVDDHNLYLCRPAASVGSVPSHNASKSKFLSCLMVLFEQLF